MADILYSKDKQLASTLQRVHSQGKPGVDDKKCPYIELTIKSTKNAHVC